MRDVTFFLYFVTANLAVVVSGEAEQKSKKLFLPRLEQKKRLIVDTDAGSDDGVAILNLLGYEDLFQDVKVQLISAVSGNTHVDNVARNILKVLKTMNRLDIPVYKGVNQSLLVTPKIENFFGKDGFGDFYFPDPPSDDLINKKHAVLALIEEVDLYPGQLTLVCLGPLTNIALAIRLDTKFLSKLKEIYILGGSYSPTGVRVPEVEFNFYVDPEAAFIVLKEAEKKKIFLGLVPWYPTCLRHAVDMNWRKSVLGTIKSPQVELINKAENLTLNEEYWISADTILSSVVIENSIVENSKVYHADVETCGEHPRGTLLIDLQGFTNLTKNRGKEEWGFDYFKQFPIKQVLEIAKIINFSIKCLPFPPDFGTFHKLP